MTVSEVRNPISAPPIPRPRSGEPSAIEPRTVAATPAAVPTAPDPAAPLPAARYPWPEPWGSLSGARPRTEYWDVITASWHSRGPRPRQAE